MSALDRVRGILELAPPDARGVMVGVADLRQLVALAEATQEYAAGMDAAPLYRALAALIATERASLVDCDPGDEQR